MDNENIEYVAGMVRAALEGQPQAPELSPSEAQLLLNVLAEEGALPKGELPDRLRDPELLAVLRPGVRDLLVKIVTRRRPNSGCESSAIGFVEWLIKRHNFCSYLCPDGMIQAEVADLTEEVYDLNLRDAAQRGEIDRLHDALLAVDRTCANAEAPAEALAGICRLTQAALQGPATPAARPNAQATLEQGRQPAADAGWIEGVFTAGLQAANRSAQDDPAVEPPDRDATTPAHRLWWWRGYYYGLGQLDHATRAASPQPGAA